jgi:beta-galactosidase
MRLLNVPHDIPVSEMCLAVCALLAFAGPLSAAAPATQPIGRETLSLDHGWRFFAGDIPFPVIKGHEESYSSAKAGKAWGAAAPEFDDAEWPIVNLPHDWVVEQPFDQNANLSQGYRDRGIAWYRRQIKLSPADRGKHLELQFDGIATNCTVWFNGTLVQRNWCGYTSFYIDITALADYGDDINTIAIRDDANAMEGWWYEGGGIYRHTYLVKRDPLHVITDGVFANPIKQPDGTWSLPVEVTVENVGHNTANANVEVTLRDPDGKEIAKQTVQASVNPLDQTIARLSIPVAQPHLWSIEDPFLYHVKTVVKRDNTPVDSVSTRCGFRTIRFDADKGFFLNDKSVKIKGVCNHQDHAGVGVAMPDSIIAFRLRRLKEMGVNAYRCSHNPPAKEMLDLCDQMGIMVMDENRNFNSSPDYMRQLEWMVRRDRNHPSIILWSVFNEEPMQGTEQGYEMVRRMSAAVKKLDTSRPVTAAMSNGLNTPINVSQAVDVVGFNYQQGSYDRFHADHPTRPITSSEDTSAVMTRGEFVDDRKNNLLDSYDDQHPPWGATHHVSWFEIAKRPFVAGGFCWTGFDYRGEPTPFQWPSASSSFGCMDLCGFPKTAYYLRQAQWIDDKPELAIVPHWSWPGSEGKPIKVLALTNADSVALSLNGKLIEQKSVDQYKMATWEVPYVPGKLEAVATKDGKEVARYSVETTGVPAAIQLIPDRDSMAGDGLDAIPVTVEVVDDQGRVVPTAGNPIDFATAGGANLIGLGNGNPNCHEPEKGNHHSVFNGLAQVILQTQENSSGTLTLRATSDGLKPAEITINIKPASPPPWVPAAEPTVSLTQWRMAPPSTQPIDPTREIASNDMNSWSPVHAGHAQPLVDGTFTVLRAVFTPRLAVRKDGGVLVFKRLAGKAQVWQDKTLLGKKEDFAAAPFTVTLAPGDGPRTISIQVEGEPGKPTGLAGAVLVNASQPAQ